MISFREKHRTALALVYGTGTATRNGLSIDVRGYEGVAFLVSMHAVAASGATLRIQGSNNGSAWSNLDGVFAPLVTGFAGQGVLFDIVKPVCRYMRVAVTKDGENATAESAMAILYKGGSEPPKWRESDAVNVGFSPHRSPKLLS